MMVQMEVSYFVRRERLPPPDNAKCRKLDKEIVNPSSLQAVEQGILVDENGCPLEPDSLYYDFLLLGVPMELALAEAWMTTAKVSFKGDLLQELQKKEFTNFKQIFSFVIEAYLAEEQNESLASHEKTVESEAFDVAAAAFVFFRRNPDHFEYSAEEHSEICSKLGEVLRNVMEINVPGPWQNETSASEMDTDTFDNLLDECLVALQLRKCRNACVAHCWKGGPRERRQRLLDLLKSALLGKHRLVSQCNHLLEAAARSLEKGLKEELEAKLKAVVVRKKGPPLKRS